MAGVPKQFARSLGVFGCDLLLHLSIFMTYRSEEAILLLTSSTVPSVESSSLAVLKGIAYFYTTLSVNDEDCPGFPRRNNFSAG